MILFPSLFCPAVAGNRLTGTGGRITLHARNIPLQDLLQDLAAAGIRVSADPKINPVIRISLENEPMESALRRILSGINHVLVWEAAEKGKPPVLAEVQVFHPGRRTAMKSVIPERAYRISRLPGTDVFFVSDELLVRLPPGSSRDRAAALAIRMGGRLAGFHRASATVRLVFPPGIDLGKKREEIRRLFPDAAADLNRAFPSAPPYRWPNGDRLADPGKSSAISGAKPAEGTGIVAVFDSGLMPSFAPETRTVAAFDAVLPGAAISDEAGHGTQMSLIASGAALPVGADAGGAVDTVSVRIMDDNGVTSAFSLMNAIDFAADQNARVLNLSWGSETDSAFLRRAMDYAGEKGLLVVAAAGNEPAGTPVYPAAYDNVIGVGALAPDGNKWEKSNYGASVDIAAPGFASLPVGYNGDPGAYAGTSIASAYAAGQAAIWLADHPESGPEELGAWLRTAFPVSPSPSSRDVDALQK